MDTPPVTLSPDEQRRLYVLTELLAGRLTTIEAALTLDISIRPLKRLKARYRREGVAALVHGNRGRRPWHAIDPALAERVVELARTTYAGLNHSHLADLLAEREGIDLDRSTIRRLLVRAGSPSPRPRRPPAHRSRRERMARAGVLLQADGSRHRWFGPNQRFTTLIGAVDDATGTVPAALFREHEDAAGYLAMLRAIAEGAGIPLALYVDRHGIFTKRASERLTLEEELVGSRLPTQVGRALDRLYLNAYIPELQRPPLVKRFLEREATPIASPALFQARSNTFVKDLGAYAQAHGAPWITFERGERKEDRMKPLFEAAEQRLLPGLVAVGVAQERTTGWKGTKRPLDRGASRPASSMPTRARRSPSATSTRP